MSNTSLLRETPTLHLANGAHKNKFQKEREKELESIRENVAACNVHGNPSFEVSGLGLTEELPEEVSSLTKVRKLQCTNNFRLQRIPESFGDLYEKLEVLNLGYNNLKTFPLCLTRLKYLVRLDVSNNAIACLPTKIDQMKSLEVLCLDSNEIMAMPHTTTHMKTLQTLYLENNPLVREDDENPADPPIEPSITMCSVTGEPLSVVAYHFVSFVDCAGVKRLPVHYVCGTEAARDLAIEEKDKEAVDYWSLKY